MLRPGTDSERIDLETLGYYARSVAQDRRLEYLVTRQRTQPEGGADVPVSDDEAKGDANTAATFQYETSESIAAPLPNCAHFFDRMDDNPRILHHHGRFPQL